MYIIPPNFCFYTARWLCSDAHFVFYYLVFRRVSIQRYCPLDISIHSCVYICIYMCIHVRTVLLL